MFATASTFSALLTALPDGNGNGDVFTTVDNLGSSTASSLNGLSVAVGCIAAVAALWATGFKFTVLRCFMAAVVGACAYLAMSDWQMFTDLIRETIRNATGQGG